MGAEKRSPMAPHLSPDAAGASRRANRGRLVSTGLRFSLPDKAGRSATS